MTLAAPRSLKTKFLLATLVGEILFGLVLGFVVALYTIRAETSLRERSLQTITDTVAASLMPLIADQETARVEAQVESILALLGNSGIECLCVRDGSGHLIAHAGRALSQQNPTESRGLLVSLRSPQILTSPVRVGDVLLAQVTVEFPPIGLLASIGSPLLLAVAVVLSVTMVSLPWTEWLFVRAVAEPLEELREGAQRLASGDRTSSLSRGTGDEIDLVARSLDEMSAGLARHEADQEDAYRAVQKTYEAESRAKHELEQLARMKSDFVAVASHEIRAPLAVIRLYAEMLADGTLGTFQGQVAVAHEAIESAASRLSSLTSDLMDASLLERGVIQFQRADFRLDEVVRDAVGDFDALGSQAGTRVELEPTDAPLWIHADIVRVRQVLDNLLSNALKYSEGASLVTVRTFRRDNSSVVQVVDRGRGLHGDHSHQVFQYFGRLDSEDNRGTAGLGLGLAISARIVDAHSGTLTFHANPEGRGTVFELCLPPAVESARSEGRLTDEVRVFGEQETTT